MNIQETLFSLADAEYRAFQAPLIPNLPADAFIGVRTPALKAYAKEINGTPEADAFMQTLPHRYFDENQLHAFLISACRDYDAVLRAINRFLPFVNNWATCDQLRPAVFKKHTDTLILHIREWLGSSHVYTVRFGIGMLMAHYLDSTFQPEYLELAAGIQSTEYYINMMRAWYFATALAKQYDAVIPFITGKRLDQWTHNKTIQKARESRRISDEQKKLLYSLRIC